MASPDIIAFKKGGVATAKVPLVAVKFLFVPYSIILLILSFFLGGVLASVTLFALFTLSVIVLFNRGTLTDPRMLFVGFLFLYSTFYPLRVALTGFSVLEINLEILKQSVNYSFLGAIVFVNIANILIKERSLSFNLNRFNRVKQNNPLFLSESLIFLLFSFVVVFMLFYVLMSGAETKLDVAGPIVQIGHFSLLIMITIFAIRIVRLNEKFYWDKIIPLFFLFVVIYLLVTGERDAVFRVALICILIFFDQNKKAGPFMILVLLIAAAIIVPLSQAFKAVMLSGDLNIPSLGMGAVLSNEFISASRNLYSVMLFEAEQTVEHFFTDVGRAIIPSMLLPDINLESSNRWFNSTFRGQHGFDGAAGWGFGIIAHGYIIAGVPGVIFIMTIYSSIICYFFNARTKSIYWYIFYILMLVTAIYCIRADLANFLSQSFKVTGTFIFLLIFSHFIMRKDLHNKLAKKSNN